MFNLKQLCFFLSVFLFAEILFADSIELSRKKAEAFHKLVCEGTGECSVPTMPGHYESDAEALLEASGIASRRNSINFETLPYEVQKYVVGEKEQLVKKAEEAFNFFSAIYETSQLANGFFNTHGVDTEERCDELETLIMKWIKKDVDVNVLINAWVLTKLSIADANVIRWVLRADSYRDSEIEKAKLPKILTKDRIHYLIYRHVVLPIEQKILSNVWKMAYALDDQVFKYLIRNQQLEEVLQMIEGENKELVNYKRFKKDREDVEELSVRKERVREQGRYDRKVHEAFIGGNETLNDRINETLDEVINYSIQRTGMVTTSIGKIGTGLYESVSDTILGGYLGYYGGGLIGLISGDGWSKGSELGPDFILWNQRVMNEKAYGSIFGSVERV